MYDHTQYALERSFSEKPKTPKEVRSTSSYTNSESRGWAFKDHSYSRRSAEGLIQPPQQVSADVSTPPLSPIVPAPAPVEDPHL